MSRPTHVPTFIPVVQYKVAVTTGKRHGSGTDADVYLCLAGERGDTGDRWLRKSLSGINKFEKGDVSIAQWKVEMYYEF